MPTAFIGTDIILFFIIGLLGGAHCIGMCGPLVTIYAGQMTNTRPDGGYQRQKRGSHLTPFEVRQHMLFNIGRTLGYTLAGVLMGTLGWAFVVSTQELTAMADIVMGVVGAAIGGAIVVIGVQYIVGRISFGVHLPGTQHVTTWLTSWVERLASGPGIVALGSIHALLPCPILYPAYFFAFTTGSPIAGGTALAALGLGTIPAVFIYGTVIDSVDAVHRQRLHRVLGIAFVVLGYILFAHGLMLLGYHIPHPHLPFWDPLDAPGLGGH